MHLLPSRPSLRHRVHKCEKIQEYLLKSASQSRSRPTAGRLHQREVLLKLLAPLDGEGGTGETCCQVLQTCQVMLVSADDFVLWLVPVIESLMSC